MKSHILYCRLVVSLILKLFRVDYTVLLKNVMTSKNSLGRALSQGKGSCVGGRGMTQPLTTLSTQTLRLPFTSSSCEKFSFVILL